MSVDSIKISAESLENYEKQIYDLKQMLEISKSFSSVLEIKKVIESILYICMCQMRTLSAALFTQKGFEETSFTLDSNYNGMVLASDINYSIPEDHPAIHLLETTNSAYTYEEIVDILSTGKEGIDFLETLYPSLIVPLKVKNRLNGFLVLGERIDLGEGNVYTSYEKSQIMTIASLAAIAINNASLMDMATTDMMTHLKLKHYFFTVLIDKLDHAYIDKKNIAVFMLDIDHFKKFNDVYGHACGDMVLTEVASLIKDSIRSEDLAARYGGEEFVVLLPDVEQKDAFEIAERIRTSIEQKDFVFENQHMNVSISVGIAMYFGTVGMTAKKLVEQADMALYESKNTGRNKTSIYAEPVPAAKPKRKSSKKAKK
ncbi:MAG: sensor domain-containing diguanylate cyclase [Treponemataceae bacterium]|nr:sensor domain-containing diguanylate cyclase [Treponemataceae bacterium]